MNQYQMTKEALSASPKKWLVTGGAGFIGSNLIEELLRLGQSVVCLDNFSTGRKCNLDDVRNRVGQSHWERFSLIEADIADPDACKRACAGVNFVLHHAALGSVPRSISEPAATNQSNVNGFVNMLVAANESGVNRFVYASSSAIYGDHPGLPKVEGEIGNCLSPYAVSKRVNELYADVFGRCYEFQHVGLRYFNVFGPRQDPNGSYAAVIPKWVDAMIRKECVYINGDGETSRDFCYVANVVQANLLAATTENPGAVNQVYNIAVGERTTLNQLFEAIKNGLLASNPGLEKFKPVYRDFRSGDVQHSHADISKARQFLGYAPTHSMEAGLQQALNWYVANTSPAA